MTKKNIFSTLSAALISLVLIFALASCDQEEEHEHSFGEWKTVKEATCTTDGSAERACECGEKETKKLPAISHTEVIDAPVAPTCTADGLTEGKHCTACGAVILKQEVISAKHSYVETTVPPTVTEDGYISNVCSVCGDSYTAAVIPASGSSGLVFELGADGKSYFVSSLGTCADTEIFVPAIYNSLPVTAVGKNAFASTTSVSAITRVVLPDSIVSIGDKAFSYCVNLKSVNIPNGVRTIGNDAFEFCLSLETVELPNGLTAIGDKAFFYCQSLSSLSLPNTVTEIGAYAFEACISLEGIDIPSATTRIGDGAFKSCTSLESAYIPQGITHYPSYIFSGCIKLKTVTVLNNATEIGEYAFEGCSLLENVTIPESVTKIGSFAFFGCEKLDSLRISKNVTAIGDGALSGTGSKALTVDVENTSFRMESDCLIEIATGRLIIGFSNGNVPDGVTVIGSYAFYGSDITEMIIPDSVTVINGHAFSNCGSLKKIVIGKNARIVTSQSDIGSYFSGCGSLTSISVSEENPYYRVEGNCLIEKQTNVLIAGCAASVIPESVVGIADGAFYNIPSLMGILIPGNVAYIGQYAFSGCEDLIDVIILDGVETIDVCAFYECSALIRIQIPASVKSIRTNALGRCASIQSATVDSKNPVYRSEDGCIIEKNTERLFVCFGDIIPDGIKTIGSGAFSNAEFLELIVLPKSVKTIEDFAFNGCVNLYAVLYGGTLKDLSGISVELGSNIEFATAAVCFYSERRPTSTDNVYWHYVNGIPTLWQ